MRSKYWEIRPTGIESEMTVCCRCNAGGKCSSCTCVKARRLCTNCLPTRRGHCSNTMQPPASPPPPALHLPTTTSLASSPTSSPTSAPVTSPAMDTAPVGTHPPPSPSRTRSMPHQPLQRLHLVHNLCLILPSWLPPPLCGEPVTQRVLRTPCQLPIQR